MSLYAFDCTVKVKMMFQFKTVKTLNDIDRTLILADNIRIQDPLNVQSNLAAITEAHFRILCDMQHITYAYIETRYRALASNTFLLASPISDLPDHLTAIDIRTKKPTKYCIWIGLNGLVERNQFMRRLAIDYETNLERLKETGILARRVGH